MWRSPPDMRPPPRSKLDGGAGNKSRHVKSARCNPAPLQTQPHCIRCNASLHADTHGRPKKYCSNKCRQSDFRNRRHLGAQNPASPLHGAPAPLLARVRANLPHADVLGGHHRGAVDPSLRHLILIIEIEGALAPTTSQRAFGRIGRALARNCHCKQKVQTTCQR